MIWALIIFAIVSVIMLTLEHFKFMGHSREVNKNIPKVALHGVDLDMLNKILGDGDDRTHGDT